MTTTIHIKSFPPSNNNLFANVQGRGRVRSSRYRGWSNAAGWDLKLAKPETIAGPVNVTLLLGKPDNRRRDLDNHAKAICDLLVEHSVISDDSAIQRLTLAWAPVTGCHVTIEEAA